MQPHSGDIASISFPVSSVRATQRLSAVSGGDMDSLEKELRELNVSPPTRRKNESNTAETSDRNAAATSLSHLDHFIRDLDERKGKLPCSKEVVEIQTSVERLLKGLLSVVEEELPFYKTTLVESGSFYEGTKVGQPDEFDYFVQLDNFSRPEDIRFEELSHCMVAVIPSDSAMDKFIETKKKCSRYSSLSFQWKRDVKTLFIDTFNNIFGQLGVLQAQEKVTTFGLKALPRALDRHGPAYTLELEWCKGQLYKGLKIKIDLSLAVKINSHSSTMKVDFESGAGKVVKSLLHTLPYYFAVSGYTEYDVPPSNLFKELEDKQNRVKFDRDKSFLELVELLFPDSCSPDVEPIVPPCENKVLRDRTGSGDTDYNTPSSNVFNESKESQKRTKRDCSVSLQSQSDCLLRISQSCLEQSLFRDHFGPDGGPSVCLRVLKVLRDMTLPLHKSHSDCPVYFNCKNGIVENAWEMITAESVCSKWQTFQRYHDPMEDNSEPDSTRLISSYSLKTLVLFEWSETPEDEQWTGSNLSQRLVNIVTRLLFILKRNKGLPSFWYENYNVLPSPDEKEAESLPEAINRVTVILRFVSSFENDTKYSFEQCIQNLKDMVMLTKQKQEVTEFLRISLQHIFERNIKKVLRASIGERKKIPEGFGGIDFDVDFIFEQTVFSGIYINALLNKIAPEEELILSYYSEYKKERHIVVSETECLTKEEAEEIVKKARELYREIARKRMNTLGTDLPDYRLWSQDFKPDEMANLLKLLCENFEKDLDIWWNKICNLKKAVRTPGNEAET